MAAPGRTPRRRGGLVTVTVIRSGTVVPGDGTASLPGTDVVIVDGAVRDLPSSDPERPYDRADLVIDAAARSCCPA